MIRALILLSFFSTNLVFAQGPETSANIGSPSALIDKEIYTPENAYRDPISTDMADPEICTDPVKVICAGFSQDKIDAHKKLVDEIRDKATKAIEDKFKLKDFKKFLTDELPKLQENYIKVMVNDGETDEAKIKVSDDAREKMFQGYDYFLNYSQEVEDQVFKKLAQKGITHDKYIAKIDEIRDALKKEVGNKKNFETKVKKKVVKIENGVRTETEVEKTQAEFIQMKVSKIALLKAKDLIGKNIGLITRGMFESCGVDALAENAFYHSWINEMVFCPGYLLLMYDGGIDALSFVTNHEMGHAFDYSSTSIPKIDESYKPFIDCIDTNFASEFNTIEEAVDQQKKALPELEKLLADKEKALELTPDDDALKDAIFRIKRALAKVNSRIPRLESQARLYPATKYTKAQTHSGELVADYWGYIGIAKSISNVKKNDRVAFLTSQLGGFCESSDTLGTDINKIVWGNLKTEGIHPPEAFRIENVMRHPDARKALGCTALAATDKPWCDFP